MRIIAFIDQASIYVYSKGPPTVVGTSPGPEYLGVYWASCVGVALGECRLHPRNVHRLGRVNIKARVAQQDFQTDPSSR